MLIEAQIMTTDRRQDIADLLRRFLRGDVEEWEFDDFISSPSDDKLVEEVRRRVAEIPDKFPPSKSGHYASSEGLSEISSLADRLSKPW
jgi:hypothetical protein